MNMISPITLAQASEARPVEDAEMERVWAELVRRHVAYYGFDRQHYDTDDEAERAFDEAGSAFWEYVTKLGSTPTPTVFGVAVKMAVVYMVDEGQPEDPDTVDRMACSAFRDACIACGRDLIGEADRALAAERARAAAA